MSKYNFKFGDVWLSEFGGVCTEVPPIEIASKDVTLIDIPNKDGSDCIILNLYFLWNSVF